MSSRQSSARREPAIGNLRAGIAARLRVRRTEIEQAVLTRLHGIANPKESDPTYREGLRASVSVGLDYAIEFVEHGEERAPLPPPTLLIQARMAARLGVDLGTVLRRYVAGYTILGDFLAREAQAEGLANGASPVLLLQGRAALLDRLLAAVVEEYSREADDRLASSEQGRAQRIERLLAGELIDTSTLGYDFDLQHLGVIAVGPGAAEALRRLLGRLDCRSLLLRRDAETAWAWLGARRALDPAEVEVLAGDDAQSATVALGEPAAALAGWRLTHRQAAAAMPIATLRGVRVVRYADVALAAAIRQDDVFAESLRRLYLDPLRGARDGGTTAFATLQAYLASARNVSSTAAALGVSRRTVSYRLRAIEQRLGRSLDSNLAEIDAALRLDELGRIRGETRPNRAASAASRFHIRKGAGGGR